MGNVSRTSDWAASGLAYLDRPVRRATGLLARRRAVRSPPGDRRYHATSSAAPSTPPRLLAGRAALRDLRRRGRISAGGATNCSRPPTGGARFRLPRDDDIAAVPALMEVDRSRRPLASAGPLGCNTFNEAVVSRAKLLDIAAAALGEAAAGEPVIRRHGLRDRRTPAGWPSGGRSVVVVGRPVVRAAARAGRGGRRESGKPGPTGRHPPW